MTSLPFLIQRLLLSSLVVCAGKQAGGVWDQRAEQKLIGSRGRESVNYTPNITPHISDCSPGKSTIEFLLNCCPMRLELSEGGWKVVCPCALQHPILCDQLVVLTSERDKPKTCWEAGIMQISPPFCGVANTFPSFINEGIETERAKVICQMLCSWSVTKLGFTLGSVSKYSHVILD